MTAPFADKTIDSLSVLVADPTPNMSVLVTTMLRTLKVRDIRDVTDAVAAMMELELRQYDVMVIDDRLAGGALQLVRDIRAESGNVNRNIAVIMMSAAPDVDLIKEARDAGVTEFLRKPFSAQHIETRLRSILNAPRDFIAVSAYAGPDRRRRSAEFNGEDRRGGRR